MLICMAALSLPFIIYKQQTKSRPCPELVGQNHIFISGFAERNEKIYITDTCKMQVVLQKTKEHDYEPDIEQSTGEHRQHFPKISKIDEHYSLDPPGIVSTSLPLRWRHETDRAS